MTVEPGILTANTYYWHAAPSASSRRSNEARHLATVAEYFTAIGMHVCQHDSSKVMACIGNITVEFSYSESCKNVYKHLKITRNGKNSNITALRKIVAMTPEQRTAWAATIALKEAK